MSNALICKSCNSRVYALHFGLCLDCFTRGYQADQSGEWPSALDGFWSPGRSAIMSRLIRLELPVEEQVAACAYCEGTGQVDKDGNPVEAGYACPGCGGRGVK